MENAHLILIFKQHMTENWITCKHVYQISEIV